MNIESEVRDGIAVVRLAGEIDGQSAPQAQAQLVPIVAAHDAVILDLAGVTYMSSAGLRMLLLVYRQATAKGGKVALVDLSEPIRDAMAATGFIDFFVVSASIEDAVKSLKGG